MSRVRTSRWTSKPSCPRYRESGRLQGKHPPAVFTRIGTPVTYLHPLGYEVISETLHSQAYYLADGDLIFTEFQDTPIPMPSGDYAVLGFGGEMVDCNNVSVPLDVIYNHHWLMKPISGPTVHNNAPCPANQMVLPQLNEFGDFTYVFGVGAESRKTPAVIPEGYGYRVHAGTKWGANIHAMHVTGLAGGAQGVKECIECWAGEKKACAGDMERANGTFSCCVIGTCPVEPGADGMTTEYRMAMTLQYTRNITMIKPVDVETYLAPNCSYECQFLSLRSLSVWCVHWFSTRNLLADIVCASQTTRCR